MTGRRAGGSGSGPPARRGRVLKVRVSAAEQEAIARRARDAGQGISDHLRACALRGGRPAQGADPMTRLMGELVRLRAILEHACTAGALLPIRPGEASSPLDLIDPLLAGKAAEPGALPEAGVQALIDRIDGLVARLAEAVLAELEESLR